MTDECAKSLANGTDKGEGGGVREMLWFCEKFRVNDVLGDDLCGGDTT